MDTTCTSTPREFMSLSRCSGVQTARGATRIVPGFTPCHSSHPVHGLDEALGCQVRVDVYAFHRSLHKTPSPLRERVGVRVGAVPSATAPRCRGSRMSRRASPAKANPSTVMLRAMPGKTSIHGAVSQETGAAWPVSIPPHDGVGGSIPRPRKDSPASVRMAVPNMDDMMMRKGAMELGGDVAQYHAPVGCANGAGPTARSQIRATRWWKRESHGLPWAEWLRRWQ